MEQVKEREVPDGRKLCIYYRDTGITFIIIAILIHFNTKISKEHRLEVHLKTEANSDIFYFNTSSARRREQISKVLNACGSKNNFISAEEF